MTIFYYRAVDTGGKSKAGELDAHDRPSAIRALRAQALTPVEISLTDTRRFRRWLPQKQSARGLDATTLALFLQQLSSLLAAGLRLDVAIATLACGFNGPVSHELKRLQQAISEGRSLSEAFSRSDKTYPDFVVKLVAAGERSGKLSAAIARAAGLLTRTLVLKQKLVSALIYPALLVIAGIATALLVVTFVLPKFMPIFVQSRIELPLSTRILMWTSDMITLGALPSLIGPFLLVFAVKRWRRSEAGRLRSDRAILRIPVVGRLVQLSEMGRLNVALEELVSGGVPLADALSIAQEMPANRAVRLAVREVATSVRGGHSLAQAISANDLFPPFMTQIVRVAEEIGNLAHGFGEIGRYLDADLQRRLDRLLTILTPLITLVMGGMVAMIIVSVLSALLKLNELAF